MDLVNDGGGGLNVGKFILVVGFGGIVGACLAFDANLRISAGASETYKKIEFNLEAG
jgi:hypothetical protein